jgi:hypothetical protein
LDDMRARELEVIRKQVVSDRRKAEAAARRMKVISDMARSIAIREQTGLESTDTAIAAEADVVRARYELVQAQSEAKVRWMRLRAACRMDNVEMRSTTILSQLDVPSPDVPDVRQIR